MSRFDRGKHFVAKEYPMSEFSAKRYSLRWLCSIAFLVLFVMTLAPTEVSRAASTQITRPFFYGAWMGGYPTTAGVTDYEHLSGRHLDVGQFFINWSTSFSSILPFLQSLDTNHSQAMVTWEPWEYTTQQIRSGQADAYIHGFARGIHTYGKTIQIRPMHEMNGNWYPWALGNSMVNTNTSSITAWKHIVDIFRQEGATNAKFVWCISASNVGVGASFTGAYPGDSYVDYVGVDGYNWGTTQSWGSTWQTFDQIFAPSYQSLTQISSRPVLIPEWASTEIGGNKAAWITNAFQQLSSSKYSRVVGAYWFNMNKETDWRINSSSPSLTAYKTAIT
jgi:beta-mannanase